MHPGHPRGKPRGSFRRNIRPLGVPGRSDPRATPIRSVETEVPSQRVPLGYPAGCRPPDAAKRHSRRRSSSRRSVTRATARPGPNLVSFTNPVGPRFRIPRRPKPQGPGPSSRSQRFQVPLFGANPAKRLVLSETNPFQLSDRLSPFQASVQAEALLECGATCAPPGSPTVAGDPDVRGAVLRPPAVSRLLCSAPCLRGGLPFTLSRHVLRGSAKLRPGRRCRQTRCMFSFRVVGEVFASHRLDGNCDRRDSRPLKLHECGFCHSPAV